MAYAHGINRRTTNINASPIGEVEMDHQGSANANSGVGSECPANSAMANSDMQDGPGKLDDSDGSYDKL